MRHFLLLFTTLFATTCADVGLVTVPKSGTHLLLKLMKKIGTEVGAHEPLVGIYADAWCSFWHTCATPKYTLTREKVLFGVRDPRDVILSTVHWYDLLVNTNPENFSPEFPSQWIPLSFREKVHYLISKKNELVCGELASMMHLIRSIPSAKVLFFEDLVGAFGGGSKKTQHATIVALLDYLDLSLSNEKIAEIQASLFGGTATFRKGTINQWKEYPYPEDFDDPLINNYINFLEELKITKTQVL